eukprot:364612-Chlamydomonas_euryale.AAC.28
MLAWPVSSRPGALVPTIQNAGGLFSPTLAAPFLSSSVISTASLLTAWTPASSLSLPPRLRCSCLLQRTKLQSRTNPFHDAFSALKARSIIIDVAAKASAVLRSAVAAAKTVHGGNAYMIFRAICTGGPRRRPRQVLRLQKGV